MTKEEARREIDSLDFYLQNHTDDYSEESHTAMVMAIKALEQEPCKDCVSRKAVLDIVKFEENWLFDSKSNNADTDIAFSSIRTQVAKLSPVTSAQKWIPSDRLPEDCISRKALLDKKWDVPYDGKYIQVVDVGDIKELPSVTPARAKGHWIDHSNEGYVECSNCGSCTNCDGNINNLHFCFSCGAEMESEE